MSITTTTVTGTLYYADGSTANSLVITAQRLQDHEAAKIYNTTPLVATTSDASNGTFSFALARNSTNIPTLHKITLADRRFFYVTILPTASSLALGNILVSHDPVRSDQMDVTVAVQANILGGGTGSQTPWTSDIDGGTFKLTNVANIEANNFIPTGNPVAQAAGTTVLTATSAQIQRSTGSGGQTYTLPVTTTISKIELGFLFINAGSGALTINSSGGNLVATVAAGTSVGILCNALTGTTASSWDVINPQGNLTGDVTSVGLATTVVKINGTSLAGLATGILKNTTTTGVPSIATGADLPAMTATVGGAVPTPPNNTTTFLRGDGTFATPAGGGITVGTTTSNGGSNVLLKTDSGGKANNATGLTNASGSPLTVTSQAASDIPMTILGAASQSGDLLDITPNGGTAGDVVQITGAGAININNGASQGGAFTYKAFGSRQWSTDVGNGISMAFWTGLVGWNPANGVNDVSIQRTASKVLKLGDGISGGGFGWLQSESQKRVNTVVTNATATMANLTDLTVNIQAGRKYSGTFQLIAKNSTAAEGLQFDFNGGTATWTSVQFIFVNTPIGVTLGTLTSTALGTPLTGTTATTADAVYTIFFTGVCNAAGTLIPRFAEVSHAVGTATVEVGSMSNLNDLP